MPRVVAEVAVPPPARPRLQLHGERLVIGHPALGAQLREDGLERHVRRGGDVNLPDEVERLHFEGRFRGLRRHDHFSLGWGLSLSRAMRWARALIRSSWWVQKRSNVSAQSWMGLRRWPLILYMRCRPWRRTLTSPTSLSTPRCLETIGWGHLRARTMSLTGRSPPAIASASSNWRRF